MAKLPINRPSGRYVIVNHLNAPICPSLLSQHGGPCVYPTWGRYSWGPYASGRFWTPGDGTLLGTVIQMLTMKWVPADRTMEPWKS